MSELGKGLYRSTDTLTVATPLKKMSFLHQQQLKLPSIEVNRLVNRFFIGVEPGEPIPPT